jgi:hypothetical protein
MPPKYVVPGAAKLCSTAKASNTNDMLTAATAIAPLRNIMPNQKVATVFFILIKENPNFLSQLCPEFLYLIHSYSLAYTFFPKKQENFEQTVVQHKVPHGALSPTSMYNKIV